MKKLFLLIASFFLINENSAQSITLGEYSHGRSVRVSNFDRGDNFSITIMTHPIIRLSSYTISLNSTDVEAFRQFLLQVKETYVEWRTVARENKVPSMRREMAFLSPPTNILAIRNTPSVGYAVLDARGQELQPVFVWSGVDRRGRGGSAWVEIKGMMEVSERKRVRVPQGTYRPVPLIWELSNVNIERLLSLLDPERIRTAIEDEIRVQREREEAQREIDNLFSR